MGWQCGPSDTLVGGVGLKLVAYHGAIGRVCIDDLARACVHVVSVLVVVIDDPEQKVERGHEHGIEEVAPHLRLGPVDLGDDRYEQITDCNHHKPHRLQKRGPHECQLVLRRLLSIREAYHDETLHRGRRLAVGKLQTGDRHHDLAPCKQNVLR